MKELVEAAVSELIKQSPLMVVFFLACLGEFLWFKHAIKVIENFSKKALSEIRKAYNDAYQKALDLVGNV